MSTLHIATPTRTGRICEGDAKTGLRLQRRGICQCGDDRPHRRSLYRPPPAPHPPNPFVPPLMVPALGPWPMDRGLEGCPGGNGSAVTGSPFNGHRNHAHQSHQIRSFAGSNEKNLPCGIF